MERLATKIPKIGIVLGAGASVATPSGALGLGNMAAALPAMGAIGGAALAVKAAKKLHE